MEQKIITRGGARPGSGRKPGREQKRTVSFRLTSATIDNIRQLREMGFDVTALLEDFITKTLQSCE